MPDFDSPMPLSSVVTIGVLFLACLGMSALMISQYSTILLHQAEFVNYSPLALVFFALVLLMGLLLAEAYIRNIRKSGAPSEKFKQVVKYCLAFSVVCLLAGPLIVRPVMNAYMKSTGYEYCPGDRSALDKTLSQNWAKPSVGCEVWDLPRAELKAMRLQGRETSE